MLKEDYYRQLASANRRIADARERLEQQKTRVLQLEGRACSEAVRFLRILDKSVRLMIQHRAVLIRQLVYWQDLR
jgi:hypothetical protein